MKPVRLKDFRTHTACLHGHVLAYLTRLCCVIAREDGAGLAARPSELEPFIIAAGDLVRRFIFVLACSKLRHSGLAHAANALLRANQQTGHALPDDLFQHFGTVAALDEVNDTRAAPDDIPAQFQRILSDFENAEALSDFIACLWGFWLAPDALTAGEGLGPATPHAFLLVQSHRRHAPRLHFSSHLSGADPPVGSNSAFRYSGLSPPPWPPPAVARPHFPAL